MEFLAHHANLGEISKAKAKRRDLGGKADTEPAIFLSSVRRQVFLMFRWTPDMIRFMRDASEYSGYNQELVSRMRPWLTPDTHICDAGCGLGYLSLALSPYISQVTAADKNPNALSVLQNNCRSRGVSNIRISCGDLFSMDPDISFHSMVFCFFGGISDILALASMHCQGMVFVFQRNCRFHRFSAGKHPSTQRFSESLEHLRRMNIPFEKQEFELEFGQPFRSMADARLFFETYNRDAAPSLITDEFLQQKLIQTGREDFPFYMPHSRPIGWIRFDARDLPTNL